MKMLGKKKGEGKMKETRERKFVDQEAKPRICKWFWLRKKEWGLFGFNVYTIRA